MTHLLAPVQTPPAFALEALEFPAVRDLLSRHASFSASRELALTLEPTPVFEDALQRQQETADAMLLPGLRPSLHMGGVHDVRPLAARAGVGATLRPEELLDIATTVRQARSWRRGLGGLRDELPALFHVANTTLNDHSGLAESIEGAIGSTGEVLDSASPELSRIRSELRGAHQRLVTRLREMMGQNPFKDWVQDPVVTERSGRYVIPVRAEARGQLPAIVHDQSASGATVFVEPLAVVEMGNRWRALQADETREVDRILAAISHEVGREARPLEYSVQGLAHIDLARAKATLAGQQRATQPKLVPTPRAEGEPVLQLLEARHPLLPGEVVPTTLDLGDEFDHLLITGPNTGGKTVALKTAGLLTMMAQAGMFIPAEEGSLVAVFDRIQADIGDEQSLQQSLSTFSSHIRRIVAMLDGADDRSLVLLDELGAGTDPQEGAALALAILGFLQKRRAYVVATTHYPEIKSYAHLTSRVQNASVEFNVETLSPTYKLTVGVPGRSNALAIARRLGMPEEVLEAAQANVAPKTAEVEALLAGIAEDRATAEDARARALKEAAEAARLKIQARNATREAERTRDAALAKARTEAEEELAELRREALRLRQRLQAAGFDRGTRAAIDEALELRAARVAQPSPVAVPSDEPLVVGQEVLVPRLGVSGRVLSARDGGVEVEVMGRRVRMKASEVEALGRSAPRPSRPEPAPKVVLASPAGDVPLTLDLRGQRAEEALERLEQYLYDAATAGLPEARIIHGKGTGALRSAVRETLRASRFVSRYSSEPDAQGGDGATAVWLSS